MKQLTLGILASGRGSNFQAIVEAIENGRLDAKAALLVSNNADANALEIARAHAVPTAVISRTDFETREAFIASFLSTLKKYGIDLIVLAGYMKKVPSEVIQTYRNRMINIHPALLPAFGGQGMYGARVHQAVIDRGCKVTGVTVHIVDEIYDHGPIVAQRVVPVAEDDTVETLSARVLQTEHVLYPEAIQLFAQGKVEVKRGRAFIHT